MNIFRLCFLAKGLAVVMLGVVLLFVDQFVSASKAEKIIGPDPAPPIWTSLNDQRQYVFDPPDWAAYAAISLGIVVVLYTVALPWGRRQRRHEHHHHA